MICSVKRVAVLSLLVATTIQAGAFNTFEFTSEFGHSLECMDDSLLTGACTAGRKKDCNNQQSASGVECNRGNTTNVEEHPGLGGDAIARGWKEIASCPNGEFAFARCSSGRNRDCEVGSDFYAHALWCRNFDNYKYDDNEKPVAVCGGPGERTRCPAGTAVIASCGAGRHADCAIESCRKQGEVFTQLLCQKYVEI